MSPDVFLLMYDSYEYIMNVAQLHEAGNNVLVIKCDEMVSGVKFQKGLFLEYLQ